MYQIRTHVNGYLVARTDDTVGLSTHANILDALHMCRVANRYTRSPVETLAPLTAPLRADIK
jgi:hypothetical protein